MIQFLDEYIPRHRANKLKKKKLEEGQEKERQIRLDQEEISKKFRDKIKQMALLTKESCPSQKGKKCVEEPCEGKSINDYK